MRSRRKTWYAMVVAMPGEPPPSGYFSDWGLVYRPGMQRGYFSVDSECLVMRLGPGMESCSLHRHGLMAVTSTLYPRQIRGIPERGREHRRTP